MSDRENVRTGEHLSTTARNSGVIMLQLWHEQVRVSTTVDGDLLEAARRLRSKANDATLLDEALGG